MVGLRNWNVHVGNLAHEFMDLYFFCVCHLILTYLTFVKQKILEIVVNLRATEDRKSNLEIL